MLADPAVIYRFTLEMPRLDRSGATASSQRRLPTAVVRVDIPKRGYGLDHRPR
jgi:hypothetical protein